MVDSSNETAGNWMPEMLELEHDAALSPPGSRQAENLSQLEAKWQQECGADSPHQGIQAGRIRGNPYHPGGAAAARFVATFEKLTGKEVVWLNTQSKDGFPRRLPASPTAQPHD